MSDRIGQQLGNYRLMHLIGQGGFAEVYLGEHVYLKSHAAIKVLYTRLANEELESFQLEARTLGHLIHPNIVRVLDFGVQDEVPFLVMDYAPNGTLRQRYPKGMQLPLPTIVGYVTQVADALQYAHNMKVIHRDIKPENILIGRNNEVLLSDFGIAIVAQSSRHSVVQGLAGTIGYMAPEQIQSHPRPASDQYALGIVVYEWLSGDRPFSGSFTEVAAKQTLAPPPPLRERVPTIAAGVEQVVHMALAKDPQQRFANVGAFATALEQASGEFKSYPTSVPGVGESSATQSSWPSGFGPLSNQTYQPTAMATPSRQPFQSLEGQGLKTPPLPSYSPATPLPPQFSDVSSARPLSAASVTVASSPLQPYGQRRLWPIIVFSVAVVLFLSTLIPWLVLSHNPPSPVDIVTPVPTATSIPSPTPVPAAYASIAGSYNGPIHNTRVDTYSNMTLSINQDQGNISGDFTVALPLQGTGPFTGSFDTKNSFHFVVRSQDTTAPILFEGMLQNDGSLSGNYCSVNPSIECDPNYGGYGVWSATHG